MKNLKKTMYMFLFSIIFLIIMGLVGMYFIYGYSKNYVVFFNEDVSGLQINSSITYEGVKIGRIKDIGLVFEKDNDSIRYDSNPYVQVIFQTHRENSRFINELKEKGLYAKLIPQGINTKESSIALNIDVNKHFRLIGLNKKYPEILSISLEDGIKEKGIRGTFQSVDSAIEQVNQFVGSLNRRFIPILPKVEKTTEDIQKIIVKIDNEISPTLTSLRSTLDQIEKTATFEKGIPGKMAEELIAALKQTSQSLKIVENIGNPDSNTQREFTETLQELRLTARSLRSFVNLLQQQPEALIRGKKK